MIKTITIHKCEGCGKEQDAQELFNEIGKELGYEMEEEPKCIPATAKAVSIPNKKKPTNMDKNIRCPTGCDYKASTAKAMYQHCWKEHRVHKISLRDIQTFNAKQNTQERIAALEEVRNENKQIGADPIESIIERRRSREGKV